MGSLLNEEIGYKSFFFGLDFFSQHAQEFAFTANKSQYDYVLIFELGHNY